MAYLSIEEHILFQVDFIHNQVNVYLAILSWTCHFFQILESLKSMFISSLKIEISSRYSSVSISSYGHMKMNIAHIQFFYYTLSLFTWISSISKILSLKVFLNIYSITICVPNFPKLYLNISALFFKPTWWIFHFVTNK